MRTTSHKLINRLSDKRWSQLAIGMFVTISLALGPSVDAAEPTAPAPAKPRVQTRLFFQDDKDLGLYWMDVTAGDKPTPGKPERVAGFPKLDPERQTLVQMREAKGYLMVGVRDEEQGGYESGWVLIRTGVEEEAHGDHSHWIYTGPPQVVATQLDSQQGNPAHVYCYDDVFYVANDALGGFTRFDPAEIRADHDAAAIARLAKFLRAGGGHITIAVAKNVAYATWIDRDGDQKGRIDIVNCTSSSANRRRCRFICLRAVCMARQQVPVKRSLRQPMAFTGCLLIPMQKLLHRPMRSTIWISDRMVKSRNGPAPSLIMANTLPC